MKIGVIGDTHKNTVAIDRAMKALEDCQLILHTGDNFIDSKYIHEKFEKDIIGVVGNCDFEVVEEEISIELGGRNVFLTHGHRYNVKFGIQRLKEKAKQIGAHIVCFGHSHRALIEEDGGILFVNPGSPALPRGGCEKSVAVIEIDENSGVEAKLIEI